MPEPVQLNLFDPIPSSSDPECGSAIAQRTGTFTDNMKLPIHRWFRYSAGFSADWVESAIGELNPQTLLDPFAGSGTVSVVADKLGINSYAVEAHPFVYRLAQGKLAWNTPIPDFLAAIEEILQVAAQLTSTFPQPIPALLSKCYTEAALEDLFKIKQAYLQVAPHLCEPLQSLIFLTISSILRVSSFVGTAPWQYVLPNKRKAKIHNPFDALTYQTFLMQEDMSLMQSLGQLPRSTLLQEDARTLPNIPDSSIDLVITSPPYANNYDYADATRLEMTFWGEVQSWSDLHEAVRKFLIRSNSQHVSKERLTLNTLMSESVLNPIRDELFPICQGLEQIRATKSGNKAYHTMIAAYFIDMAKVFQALHRVTRSESKICLIIGDSAPYGVYVPVEKWLGELALAAGFDRWYFEELRKRNVKWKNRKHRVPLHEGKLWIHRSQ
ncbi:site-specific DNA-methyltransferase [Laspinema olomoucense]|uniref:site-specific DNA-methyltransferase (cytosine-N(4)-specific) n=1 Tax=Laspinema olomoucense D3b TaxID=2953688 RepID=A0ABT2N3Q9_9CYAN|nr:MULTISPECIES: site-specific DNA-methyltransferase [unclassified Laspinema]MCT7973293.1 site-specific DNA-methyltransferase [Laspinema sp. D3d]MCT7977321.1 site-specific DNA-methyltransferase [Laspinema sp. D3b]MCT7990786.1 site-specific DNA-methyltransferase [Laspinema sp. D3a]MCT7995472.1 site-specific DNA-methyltransferase [Laspinema sp. D3c]